jgi:hypothetical protein
LPYPRLGTWALIPHERVYRSQSSGPRAPSTDSIFELDDGPTCSAGTITKGPAPTFRPLLARSTLLRSEKPRVSSRPVASAVARLCTSWGLAAFPRTQRQDASNPLLQPTFRVTSTRDKHHLWRLPAERSGKPANARLRDRPRRRDVSAVSSEDCAGPPCGHPASNSHVLDGTPPASGRPTAHLRARALRSGGKSAAAFSTACDSAGIEPSGTSHERPKRGRVSALDPITRAPFRPGTSMRRLSRSPRCLPPKKTTPEALASTGWSAAAAGRRGQTPHVFIDVRRTSTRPLFDRCSRTPSRPHALPRLLQMNVSASTTVDHLNIPNRRGRPLGRLPR